MMRCCWSGGSILFFPALSHSEFQEASGCFLAAGSGWLLQNPSSQLRPLESDAWSEGDKEGPAGERQSPESAEARLQADASAGLSPGGRWLEPGRGRTCCCSPSGIGAPGPQLALAPRCAGKDAHLGLA